MSDDPVVPTEDAIEASAKLLRAIRENEDATRRQLEASRDLVERCRRLLRKLRAGDRADDNAGDGRNGPPASITPGLCA
jgi:hypothetical protein